MNKYLLEVENLKKYYGSFLALEVAELKLMPGIHRVIGGNGSGKTTFFKTLAGLLPFKGSIIFNETLDLRKKPIGCRRLINYGEAEPLYPAMVTAKDLLGLFAKSKNATPNGVKDITEALGITPFYNQPAGSYSSGMLKKLSIALAFIGQPKLILLDEPLITLDVATVDVVYNLIEQYKKAGTSFLISSHQAFEDGKLKFDSTLTVKERSIVFDSITSIDA